MSHIEIEHPSYPGFHSAPLSDSAVTRLRRVAQAMIPNSEGFPDAGPLVSRFVTERVDRAERDLLEGLLATMQDDSSHALTTWLQRLEAKDPTNFATLRNWVYYGYYTSGSVTDALRLAGSDYHGAPQPFGYRMDRDAPLPRTPRGSYQKTAEVYNVYG
jgi:hypothetical protein